MIRLETPLTMGLSLQWITDHVIIGVAEAALTNQSHVLELINQSELCILTW